MKFNKELKDKIINNQKELTTFYIEQLNNFNGDIKEVKKRYNLKGLDLRQLKGKSNKTINFALKSYGLQQADKIINKINNRLESKIELLEVQFSTHWHKSYMWGYNPTTEVFIIYLDENGDRRSERLIGTASGCGYDKLSSSINSALYDCEAWQVAINKKAMEELNKGNKTPYGVSVGAWGIDASFSGYGLITFEDLLKWLGFEIVYNIDRNTYNEFKAVRKGAF